MTNYIGLDAHSKTCTFVVVDGRGKETIHRQVPTTERDVLGIVRSLKGSSAIAFEESGMAKWLYALLKDEVDEIVVCNAAFIARRTGAKDDYPDALHLAQQLRGGLLTAVFHDESEIFDLRAIVTSYRDLVQEIVRAKNRYKALFRGQAINTDGMTIYHDKERIKELAKETDQFIALSLFEQLQTLEEQKALYLKRFRAMRRKIPEIRALATVPGISDVRSAIIGSIVCSPERFSDKHKFWSYAMLVKHDRISDGRSYGKTTIHARADLKEVFFGAAENVLMGSSSLRSFYDELRSKGVDHGSAKTGLARKIAAVSLAVMRTKRPYEENHDSKEKRRKAVN